jgi:arsenate reductase
MTLFEILQSRRARVLFVCLGNSCRSQMAEGFARAYGGDVLEAHSAGIQPASRISRRASKVMEEKGISLAGFLPKSISSLNLGNFDVIVNLSEYSLPDTTTRVLKNALQDPMTGDEDAFRDVREDVEQVVRLLIEQFRVARQWNAEINSLYSKECAPASSSL